MYCKSASVLDPLVSSSSSSSLEEMSMRLQAVVKSVSGASVEVFDAVTGTVYNVRLVGECGGLQEGERLRFWVSGVEPSVGGGVVLVASVRGLSFVGDSWGRTE